MPSSRQESRPAQTRDVTDVSGAAAPVSHIVAPAAEPAVEHTPRPVEVGGREGPEPTRFGDWERRGRCIDF